MGILNYEFSFCLFFFAGMDIHLYSDNSSAFQAGIVVMPSSAGRWPAVMKVIAFQAKAALLSKEGDTSFFRMFSAWKAGFKQGIASYQLQIFVPFI
jgi:hypothetical protein